MYFAKNVDRRSKTSMIAFLEQHFRYYTRSSVNRLDSYANCIKFNQIGLTSSQSDAAYKLLQTDYWEEIRKPIDDFTNNLNGEYTIGTNGRSGGYLVLYASHYEMTGHKSFCRSCGQRNFKYVYEQGSENHTVIVNYVFRNRGCWADLVYLEESVIKSIDLSDDEKLSIIRSAKAACQNSTIGNKCGACGSEGEYGRINYTSLPRQLSVSSRAFDQDEEFAEWSMYKLRNRVELVSRFDRACDGIRLNFIDLIENCHVVEETVLIPKTVRRIECCL